MEFQNEWFIAVKEVQNISPELRKALEGFGAEVLDEKVYIHAHFHVPQDSYALAEEMLGKHDFVLQEEHPAQCAYGHREGFQVFEKRMPIIEAREADTLTELTKCGVLMSGGAGKPHVHVSIPADKSSDILNALKENGYFPKE